MLVLWIILSVICLIALVMAIIAIANKPSSIYKNKPEEKNPVEGKKVIFANKDRRIIGTTRSKPYKSRVSGN